MLKKIIAVVTCIVFIIIGCGQTQQETADDPQTDQISSISEDQSARESQADPVATVTKHPSETYVPEPSVASRPISDLIDVTRIRRNDAHHKFLDDEFRYLDFQSSVSTGESAVIGSKVARFYPPMNLESPADLDKLPDGIPIPLSEMVQVLERIDNSDRQYYGMFSFQDNFNYFYKVNWRGEEGIVFGADLEGYGWGIERNTITSMFYRDGSRFEDFPTFIGYRVLSSPERDAVQEQRVAFQRVDPSEYYLSLDRPDDMISLYMGAAEDKYAPIFLSTDLFANSLHLFFDRFLQDAEERFFMPRLTRLVRAYLAELDSIQAPPGVEDPYLTTHATLTKYFQIADCLLALSPERITITPEFGPATVEYREVDRDAVLSEYSDEILEEIDLILGARQFTQSPNFQYKEDYTQFKPRGHYTKNGVLETYFRAMMWFGRIHMYMAKGQNPIVSADPADYDQPSATDLSLIHLPMVALVTDLTVQNPELFDLWKELFDPITALIGASDDLSFYDVVPFFESLAIPNLREWINDKEEVTAALDLAVATLRGPLISGNSVFQAPSAEGKDGTLREAPSGWRLFGQRFTFDSFIHQQVSPPRLLSRYDVRGLDIMKVFGSETADKYLAASDYPVMERLEETLDRLQTGFDRLTSDFWRSNYYNTVLYTIKAQAEFEPGVGFYFTETPYWGVKSQLSSHGTWASLRHDTILYVKQVYAERAGDGDFNPTYRTEPVPTPVHYIEPNVDFFDGALASIQVLDETARAFGLLDAVYDRRVRAWISLLERVQRIVTLEYGDLEVPADDIAWIRTVPQQLAPLVLPPDVGYGAYAENADALKGAIVADVYTNAESRLVLEVGVGIPYRMYVALNDSQGRKRVAIGYSFSYYEFMHPMSQRMTDEEWREIVYATNEELTDYLPFWSRNVTLSPLGNR